MVWSLVGRGSGVRPKRFVTVRSEDVDVDFFFNFFLINN